MAVWSWALNADDSEHSELNIGPVKLKVYKEDQSGYVADMTVKYKEKLYLSRQDEQKAMYGSLIVSAMLLEKWARDLREKAENDPAG